MESYQLQWSQSRAFHRDNCLKNKPFSCEVYIELQSHHTALIVSKRVEQFSYREIVVGPIAWSCQLQCYQFRAFYALLKTVWGTNLFSNELYSGLQIIMQPQSRKKRWTRFPSIIPRKVWVSFSLLPLKPKILLWPIVNQNGRSTPSYTDLQDVNRSDFAKTDQITKIDTSHLFALFSNFDTSLDFNNQSQANFSVIIVIFYFMIFAFLVTIVFWLEYSLRQGLKLSAVIIEVRTSRN